MTTAKNFTYPTLRHRDFRPQTPYQCNDQQTPIRQFLRRPIVIHSRPCLRTREQGDLFVELVARPTVHL